MRETARKRVLLVALVFGLVQAGLLFAGYLFGDLFVGYVEKFAHWIGFLLLLYVGGSMVVEALTGKEEARDLNGIKNILIASVATSIDAMAVGISLSMDMEPMRTCQNGCGLPGDGHLRRGRYPRRPQDRKSLRPGCGTDRRTGTCGTGYWIFDIIFLTFAG